MELLKFLKKNPAFVWGIGGFIVGIGEYLGAFDRDEGGTISEWFWKLPVAVQFFIVWCMGGVFVHFIGWGRVVHPTDSEKK